MVSIFLMKQVVSHEKDNHSYRTRIHLHHNNIIKKKTCHITCHVVRGKEVDTK